VTARGDDGVPAPRILLVIAVCFVAANMRPAITGVGPLLEQIGPDTGLDVTGLGVLAAIPLLAWAAFSPLAHGLSGRFGLSPVLLGSMLLLAVGTILRSLVPAVAGLWIGTALIGVAIAVINVLMPAVVRRDFPNRVRGMTSAYSAILGGAGAVASGLVVPISHIHANGGELGWRFALLAVNALLPIAIVLWLASMARERARAVPAAAPPAGGPRAARRLWRDPVAWLVTMYFGLQASTFYMLLTWLATIAVSHGRSEVVAGFDVMLYQLCSIIGSLLLPLLLRGSIVRWAPAIVPVLGVAAAVGLMLAPAAIPLWAVLFGVSSGASLTMSLTLITERVRDHSLAGALSGMAQGAGYLVTSVFPIAFGALHDAFGGWFASLGLLAAALLAQCAVGVFAGRDRFVFD